MRAAALAILGAVLLSGCKVDVRLEVEAAEGGSGVVRIAFALDAAAVEALGGDVESRLAVADLVQAGWTVDVREGSQDDTADDAGDGATVVASKPFGRPEELPAVMDELSGEVGPFRDFRLERDRAQFSTSFDFTGVVDLEGGVGPSSLDPGDEGLTGALTDEGIDVEALRSYLRDRVDPAFGFEVVVRLPGSGPDDAPGTVDGEPAWRPQVGERVELTASSRDLDEGRVALVVLGGMLLVAAVAVAARPYLLKRRRAS